MCVYFYYSWYIIIYIIIYLAEFGRLIKGSPSSTIRPTEYLHPFFALALVVGFGWSFFFGLVVVVVVVVCGGI